MFMLKQARLTKFTSLILLLAPMAATASQPNRRFTISSQQIVDAMATAGLTTNLAEIEFLSEVSTTSNHAALQVVSTARRGTGGAIVKLRCHANGECLPFYVFVHNFTIRPGVQPVKAQQPAVETASFSQIVRGGDRATLILENANYRISMPVVCLQDGARGQKIRVASRDHRRFFEGEVIGTGMLKGSL